MRICAAKLEKLARYLNKSYFCNSYQYEKQGKIQIFMGFNALGVGNGVVLQDDRRPD